MSKCRTILLFLFLVSLQSGFAQKIKEPRLSKADKITVANLRTHLAYLASDKLDGRRTGTEGEKLAMEYISNEFSKAGLASKGTDGFYQAFDIYEGQQINPSTHFIINGHDLEINKEFFPFVFSPNISLEALPSLALQEVEMPWFYDLKDVLTENKSNPHFDLIDYIRTNSLKAKEKGASAVILYNSSDIDDNLKFNGKDRIERIDIPVIYVSKEVVKKYFSDESATLDIKFKIDIGDKIRTGHNVIGYIDNGAATTVVLGAHFDHLGHGEDGNSMLRTNVNQVHNGADDNASGTAALIELARILNNASQHSSRSKTKNSNYLFIAFSGEELGLNGSKYFTENPTIDLKQVNYMINMDMVGRLNDSSRALTIGGYGTSPRWGSLIDLQEKKPAFMIKIDSSGTGPSDHTSFYRKDIPVLFFFTGLHADYHKPSDDFDKINYTGEVQIIDYINKIITENNQENERLAFTKTREVQTNRSARFTVSLGVMPDYTYSGGGVRIDGVSEGRAAEKAGMKAGDVIVQLGDFNVNSVENYMEVLSKFKKGDNTKVKFKRGNAILEAPVQF